MQHDEVSDLDVTVGYLPDPGIENAINSFGSWWLDRKVMQKFIHSSPPKAHLGSAYIAGHCIEFVRSLNIEIDCIHGHFLNWPKLAADYTATYFGVPCTVTAHAFGLYKSPNKQLLRLLSDRMERVITISEYNRDYLLSDIGTSSPIDVVHMGIDSTKFQPSESVESQRILTVARFDEKKGIGDAIEAVGRISDEFDGLQYHLIGSGEKEDLIRTKINNLGLDDTVSILGHVSDSRLIRELDEAEVFLLPSVVASNGDRDGIPVAIMEAMAMKTVPISTRVSGIPELIDDGVDGFLVEPGDIDSLSEILSNYLSIECDYEIGLQAPRDKIVDEFNVETCVEGLESILKNTQK